MPMSSDLHAETLHFDDLPPGQARPVEAPPPPRSLLDNICHSVDEAGGDEEGCRDLVSQEYGESVRVVVREPVIEGHRDDGPRWVGPAPRIPGSIEGNQITFLTEPAHVPLEEFRRGGTGEAT